VLKVKDVVPGGALNLNSTNLPRPRIPRECSPSRKVPVIILTDLSGLQYLKYSGFKIRPNY